MFVVSPPRFVWLKALRKSARKRKRTLSVISIDLTSDAFTFHTRGKRKKARLRLPGRACAPLAAMIGTLANAAGFRYWSVLRLLLLIAVTPETRSGREAG